jgi:hypothetical protein
MVRSPYLKLLSIPFRALKVVPIIENFHAHVHSSWEGLLEMNNSHSLQDVRCFYLSHLKSLWLFFPPQGLNLNTNIFLLEVPYK